jgi:hypothetical protein
MRILSFYLILILAIAGTKVRAQQSTVVSGVVTAFQNIPLRNVTITSKKTGETILTDSLGRFTLNYIAKDNITVSAAGFVKKKIKIKNPDPLQVRLQYSNKVTSFEDAVMNDHISRQILEEAVKSIPGRGTKDYSIYTSIYELIDNEIHNVRVVDNAVYTTKITSFKMSQQVLYVVDEVEVSDISGISPLEVRSIKYIDGVDATMYGMRGANGIIEITLKK